ncbi:rRNA maturation RNase YbeY [Moraxella cuniculi]
MMSNTVELSFAETIAADIQQSYHAIDLEKIARTTLTAMTDKLPNVNFRYFAELDSYWYKPKLLDIYIVDTNEGRRLNLQSRHKDYATNVLSYPSDLPADVLPLLDEVHLGELVLCHEVVCQEAIGQHKQFDHHLTHLVVHGILHLLGFDHEISEQDADEMEQFEIEILAKLGINNPYLAQD